MAKRALRMGRAVKRTGLCALACLCALLLCGCKASAPVQSVNVELTPAPAPQRTYPQGEREPLQIERDYLECEEGYVLYPKVVSGSYADKINRAQCDAVRAYARSRGTQVFTEYRVEYNSNGLFSIVFHVRDLQTDEPLNELPLTFDCASGAVCGIDYYFDTQKESWRAALAGLAADKAAQQGLTLLGEIDYMQDDRPYYITESGLALQYRLYEIATYAGGWPALEIPVAELRAYLAPQSPLLRLLGE